MNGLPEQKIQPFVQAVIPPTGTDPELKDRHKLKLAPICISLYGLFDASGHCWYVGQTIHEGTRLNRHRVSGRQFAFRRLRLCNEIDASRLERQIIRAYKAKGQANLNKNISGAHGSRQSWIVYCPALGFYFMSKIHAAQFFECSHASITRALNRKDGWLNFYGSKYGPQKIFQPRDDFSVDLP